MVFITNSKLQTIAFTTRQIFSYKKIYGVGKKWSVMYLLNLLETFTYYKWDCICFRCNKTEGYFVFTKYYSNNTG